MWREKRRKCKSILPYEVDANCGPEVDSNSDGSQGKVAVPSGRESDEWLISPLAAETVCTQVSTMLVCRSRLRTALRRRSLRRKVYFRGLA